MLQDTVIEALRHRVDAWRGFALGSASEPYPEDAPRYEPAGDGERAVSATTLTLLQHWFQHEPHAVGIEPATAAFKYWPHQRRLVETFIYLHEVMGVRRTEDLYRLGGVEPIDKQRDPWPKLGGQLATGSGKTKMMSLLIAWGYLNAVLEGEEHLGIGRHSILIAPGLFVKDRLLQDFAPPQHGTSVFLADPVVPPELTRAWDLRVYDPDTCPRKLDPAEGALVVTNYHQLLRVREDDPANTLAPAERQIQLLFQADDPQKLEAVRAPLIERFGRSRGLMVLNDEAHHVWDEPGHAQFEEKARQKAELSASEDEAEAMAWIRSIRRLNGSDERPGRVGLQIDLSATLFQEAGTQKKAAKGKKDEAAQFKATELFRHTAVTYDLSEAIRDGIVKRPVLERVEVRDAKTGQVLDPVQPGAPNAWAKYKNLLSTGIERWKRVRDQLADEGDTRKPILFVLCADKNEAAEVANFLTYGNPVRDDLSGQRVTGYPDASGPLFVESGRSTVVQIHIGRKEEANEEEWEKIRAQVNAIDREEVPDPSGALDEQGKPRMVANPYNVVISVMMLKEGWDVRNVKVIVPLRQCDSRTLTEQTLGRGLRKMHPAEIDDEGAAFLPKEELFVIEHPSFRAVIDQIKDLVDEKSSEEIDHPREYVAIPPLPDEGDRTAADVRLVRLEGIRDAARDWRKEFDPGKVPELAPRAPWHETLHDTEIQTWLKRALEQQEEQGQRFTMPAEPSYRDFDHVLEEAYAKPLLREMRAAYVHKNGVKGVVKQYLERKTFNLPRGVPVSFETIIAAGEGVLALGNLVRDDVMSRVKVALLGPLNTAIQGARQASRADLSERHASKIGGYQALKKHVAENLKLSAFSRAATSNQDEHSFAVLVDDAKDVTGWVYNHRSGVGYSIPYEWQGRTAHYFPDFIVRAKFGEVPHNFIIEVKGRLDEKDKRKAERGREWCELLSEYDSEPWHYLMLLEASAYQREDIQWWGRQPIRRMRDLMLRHESMPLVPAEAASSPVVVVDSVGREEQFRDALPLFDLAVKAGAFGAQQAPEPTGWVRIKGRPLREELFVARIRGTSMEPGILDGAYGLFRSFPVGREPALSSLDNRRVVVQLQHGGDPETGSYTLKRWTVTKRSSAGEVHEITLRPDNADHAPLVLRPSDGEVRVVAEFLETLG